MKLKFVFCHLDSHSLGRELSGKINFENETKSALTCRREREFFLAKTQSQGGQAKHSS